LANKKNYYPSIEQSITALKKQTVNTINEAIGQGLLAQIKKNNDTLLFTFLSNHPADIVRCWAAYIVAKNTTLSLTQKFKQLQPFAADSHFGVREISWLAIRPQLAINLSESIQLLTQWASSANENSRRFASEATRPRGVWCEHIEPLKQNPAQALSILELLKNDTSKYVQDSVGNWLNDASKTSPNFVITLCKKWKIESDTENTNYIIKKALRTIEKVK
jgi:3-methyladenine DNA glycosylase AlkC